MNVMKTTSKVACYSQKDKKITRLPFYLKQAFHFRAIYFLGASCFYHLQ